MTSTVADDSSPPMIMLNSSPIVNVTTADQPSSSSIDIIKLLDFYYILSVVVFGILTNCLSLRIFHLKKKKTNDPNFFLAALIISDNLYLLCILIFRLPDYLYWGKCLSWCIINTYANYVFNFISSFCLVFYSLERFLVAYWPFTRLFGSINNRNKAFLLGLTFLFALAIFSYVPWTYGLLEYHSNRQFCFILNRDYVVRIVIFQFFVLTFLPYILILLINFFICVLIAQFVIKNRQQIKLLNRQEMMLMMSYQQQSIDQIRDDDINSSSNNASIIGAMIKKGHFNRQLSASIATSYDFKSSSLVGGSRLPSINASISAKLTLIRKRKKYLRSIVHLIVILSVYLLLNMPLFMMVVALFWDSGRFGQFDFDFKLYLSTNLFYLNFVLNLFLYAWDQTMFKPSLIFSCIYGSKSCCGMRFKNSRGMYK